MEWKQSAKGTHFIDIFWRIEYLILRFTLTENASLNISYQRIYISSVIIMKKNILSFFILYSLIFGQSQPVTVAVLDFEGQGISVQEVKTLTERIRSEIGNTNAVRLIERKAVDKIMAEQGLQQSGCTSDECAS